MVHLVRKKIKGNTYLYLEETARINGKPRRVWSKYLGPEKKIKEISKMNLSLGEAKIKPLDFGLPAALMQIVKRLDLIDLIDHSTSKRDQGFSVGEYMVISALNRCIEPISKHKIQKWFENSYLSKLMPNRGTFLNSMAYTNHYSYLNDSILDKIEEQIAIKLKKEFNIDMGHLMYDPTNFYTYGQGIDNEDEEDVPLPQFGHSKEGRVNCRIVGLTLVCTQDGGIPLMSHIYPGNISEAKLFKSQAKSIKNRIFKLKLADDLDLLLTFDKGNNSSTAYAELDNSDQFFLASIRPSMVKDLAAIPLQNFYLTTLPNKKRIGLIEFNREIYRKSRRLIVVYNRDRALRWGSIMLDKLESLQEKILNFFETRLNVKKWRSRKTILKKIEEIIPKRYFRYFYINLITILEVHSLTVEIKYDLVFRDQASKGKTYLITNHTSKSAFELVKLFRQQISVERAFRFLKSPKIFAVRPMFSRKNTSIRGHIFTCVLGLLLLTLLTREVRKYKPHFTLEGIVGHLSMIQVAEISIPGNRSKTMKMCNMTPESQEIADLLDLSKLI